VTAMPYRHAEKRERDRHDGYAPGYLIDERDERRCSDQMTHACRQSDWTGYAQQSAMCGGLEAIATSDACAADAEQRADDVVDYARHTGQPPRPASGQSQRYDGHPLRRSTSTERQRWMSYVAEEVPLPQRHDCDRLEPCMADLSLRPSEQNLTFRENVIATATQTESTEPCYLKKVVKRLDFMTSDRAKSRPTAKASYASTPAMHRPTINVKQRKSTPNIDVRTAYNVPSKCKASGDNYGDITNTCHYAHRNVDCVDERELRSQSANGMSVCYEKRAMERADSESSTRRASRRASSRGVHRQSSRDSDVDERQTSPGRRRGSTSSQQQHDTAERKVTTGCVKHAVQSKHVSTDKDCTDIDYAPATRESTRALPDVAAGIGQPVLRQTPASHRVESSVSRRMVAGLDSVTAPVRRVLTAATDTTARTAVLRHLPIAGNGSDIRSEPTAMMDVDVSTLF